MSSSIPIPDNLTVRNVTFNDNSRLISASDFYFDSRFRKRLRVDKDVEFRQDLTVYGNVHVLGNVTSGDPTQTAKDYVDNQTGWGYPQWTFAGATYNAATDSLIMKISNIEINYATISYVNSQLQNTNGKYLVPYAPNTFPTKVNPSLNYPYAITTLASNSGLIIRDNQNSFNEFKFQRGTITIGHVLKCLDAEGTVGWGAESSVATEQQTIITNYGATNTQYSWKVVDQASGRGVFAFPNLLSNLYNKAISPNATGILLGTGDIINYVHPFVIGCYTNGSEMIQFKNSTSTTNPNGSVRITGGSDTIDQRIELNSSGLFLSPKWNRGIQFIMPYVPKNLNQNQWSKPVSIYGKLQANDEYPTFIVTKENGASQKNSIMMNPRANSGNFTELQHGGDPQIIFGDTTQFDQNGTTAVYPTDSQTLVIAPWSYLADGIQIKNSLEIEDYSGSMISGFTRITGSANVFADNTVRVPKHYIETNRQGIIIKNSNSTETRNYGLLKVLSKSGPLINNPFTDTVTGGFQVGDVTGGFIPSSFNGDVTIENGDLYYKRSPTTNHVLTCASSTGKAQWSPVPTTYNQLSVQSITFTTDNSVQSTAMTEAKVQAMINASIAAASAVPVGTIIAWAGSLDQAIPAGYLLCNGQIYPASSYYSLYLVLQSSWGNTVGSTQFQVPNLLGAYLKGYGNFVLGRSTPINPGTYQSFSPGEHLHQFRDQGSGQIKVQPKTGEAYTTVANDSSAYFTTETGVFLPDGGIFIGEEGRPNSAGVIWLIKY